MASRSSPAIDPFERPLQLVTGKGGVGKSTVVGALAIAAARAGYRPLVVELGHRASAQSVFGCDTITYEPTEVARGVYAMNLELEGALTSYVVEHLRVRRLATAMLKNRALRRFLEAAPGVAEVLTLSRLRSLARGARGAAAEYAPIVVDLDATGHALMLLELPRALEGLVGKGPLRRVLGGIDDLLSDPTSTALHLVTVPRDLVVQETIELHDALCSAHRVPLGRLVVNRVPTTPLGAAARRVVADPEPPGLPLDDVALARRELRRERAARKQVERLRASIPLPCVELPARDAPSPSESALDDLAERLWSSR